MDVDPAILRVAQEHVAQRYEIEPALAPRLRGATLKEIEADAVRLRADLGLGPLDEGDRDQAGRDEAGRFVKTTSGDMNAIIRQAAGWA